MRRQSVETGGDGRAAPVHVAAAPLGPTPYPGPHVHAVEPRAVIAATSAVRDLGLGLADGGELLEQERLQAEGAVERFLRQTTAEPLGHLVPRLVAAKVHLLRQQGKLVRPLIVSLLGRALGLGADRLEPYTLAVELIHTASLLHDDVIDRSPLRRGRPTANEAFDNTLPVLAGDSILAEVMSRISALGDVEAIRAMAACIQSLVHGESLQYELCGRPHDDVEACLEIAQRKTAALISLCTWLPAHLALAGELLAPFAALGRHAGIAYQLTDDILDFEAADSGKPAFADWAEAKSNTVTAMMIRLQPAAKAPLAEFFADPRRSSAAECQRFLEHTFAPATLRTAIQAVEVLAAEQAALASAYAEVVPANAWGRCFSAVLQGLIHRRR